MCCSVKSAATGTKDWDILLALMYVHLTYIVLEVISRLFDQILLPTRLAGKRINFYVYFNDPCA